MRFGESASAQCTINGGDMPITVKWLLNGAEIPSYLEVSTSKIGKRINVLSIESVKADHSGNYSCVAQNQWGMAEHSAELKVIGVLCDQNQEFEKTFFYSINILVIKILVPSPIFFGNHSIFNI